MSSSSKTKGTSPDRSSSKESTSSTTTTSSSTKSAASSSASSKSSSAATPPSPSRGAAESVSGAERLQVFLGAIGSSLKKRLLSLHNVNPDTILANEALWPHRLRGRRKLRKEKLVDALLEAQVYKMAAKYASTGLNKDALIKIVVFEDDRKYTSKAAYVKCLIAKMEEIGVEPWLDGLELPQLRIIADNLYLDISDCKRDEGKMAKKVANDLLLKGMSFFLSQCTMGMLIEAYEALGLGDCKLFTKQQLVDAVVTGVPAKGKKKRVVEDDSNDPKPPIEKGITKEELEQSYYIGELRQWCKDNRLRTTGCNKTDVIKRIVKFLKGDTTYVIEPEPESSSSKGHKDRKRKRSSSGSESDKGKDTTKKGKAPVVGDEEPAKKSVEPTTNKNDAPAESKPEAATPKVSDKSPKPESTTTGGSKESMKGEEEPPPSSKAPAGESAAKSPSSKESTSHSKPSSNKKHRHKESSSEEESRSDSSSDKHRHKHHHHHHHHKHKKSSSESESDTKHKARGPSPKKHRH
ncbi:hypothetical protein Pelo_2032 [Pelomyxa schiedti]|nr:hypothetical protein Pelo_2032 [Pelomyxa schiedti]